MTFMFSPGRVRPLAWRRMLRATAVAASPMLLAAAAQAAPTYSVVYNFAGNAAGSGPAQISGHLANPNDPGSWALYGTTEYGGNMGNAACSGIGGCGTVYQLTPPAAGGTDWSAATLYTFNGGADGANSVAGLAFDAAGALYGTTSAGGAGAGRNGNGTVFRLGPPAGTGAWAETQLHRFNTSTDAANLFAGVLIGNDGSLYGTSFGGGKLGGGTIYRVSPPAAGKLAWTEQLLVSFTGYAGGGTPQAPLIADTAGALYGTAASGAVHYQGAVIKLTPPAAGKIAWLPSVLYSFNGTKGSNPVAGLIADAAGALYGTTPGGGATGAGTVFKLAPPAAGKIAWTQTVLHNFTGGADGGGVSGPLIADASGALYGITSQGGDTTCQPGAGCGTVFKLTPPRSAKSGWKLTVLHSFSGGADGVPYSSIQSGLVMGPDEALYGTTFGGGTGGFGTVFRITQ